jgi:site-specific DNA-methyltransferase (cytosine-N4-specific)
MIYIGVNMNSNHKIIIKDSIDMKELENNSIDLVITSPPYPMIQMWDGMFNSAGAKDYNQMHDYLAKTWEECFRVLKKGGLMCVNIGDATRSIDHRFKLYPNHSKIIEKCEKIGFETLPYILWQKPTNKPNAFLGSGFLPPNGYVTLDCEYILIFRKDGLRKFEPKNKERYESAFTKEERDVWFSQIWKVKGSRQNNKDMKRRTAEYPEEIVERLIKMFSIKGDTILDPFLGTGTTTAVAKKLERNSVGYEIEKSLLPIIKERLSYSQEKLNTKNDIIIIE